MPKKTLKKGRGLTQKLGFWLKIICLWLLFSSSVTFADIPRYITFQGRLTDASGTAVSDGTYAVIFRLYASETGGGALWTETQTVTVTNGVFTVSLGTVTALDLAFDAEYWLSVQVSPDQEMAPRQRLTSAGYALNANKLDTYTSSQFLRSDTSDTATGQLKLSYPGTALVIQPSSAPNPNTKLIDLQDAAGSSKFNIDYEGDASTQNATVAGTLGVSGATTVGSSLTVGTNIFTVDAATGYIGIGTTAPSKTLQVVGDTDILGDLDIGTAAVPKDITVRGNLNVAGNQVIDGTTVYAGDLIVGADGAGHAVRFYSSNTGQYLSWDAAAAKMTLAGGSELEVSGDLKLAGRIRQGTLGDLAEMLPLAACISSPANAPLALSSSQYLFQPPEPADVVIIDENGGVRRSFEPFAANVAGIISSNPAQILRDELKAAAPVALNGVVPCKVTNENGPIKPGDLLVSSSLPGYAMRAGKHPPAGTVIGKALGKCDQEKGVIDVLVMLK